jgi:hypothetical protein
VYHQLGSARIVNEMAAMGIMLTARIASVR